MAGEHYKMKDGVLLINTSRGPLIGGDLATRCTAARWRARAWMFWLWKVRAWITR